mmetsp:Transcript_11882/g.19570  ORF Transcript_11882/g.19570 Transcript_11882/m.19570 type:complete len:168 (-) Transcript_11882:23-526(-)
MDVVGEGQKKADIPPKTAFKFAPTANLTASVGPRAVDRPRCHAHSYRSPLGAGAGSLESVPKVVGDAMVRCEADLHNTLVNNMVLTGGGAAVEGMSERMKAEIESLIYATGATNWRIRLMSIGVNERALCAWLGGSIVASLGSFHELWVSKQEYDEFGSVIVDRKCP